MNLFFVKIKKLTKTWILCLRTIFYSNNSVRKPLRKYHLGHGPKARGGAHYLRQKNEEMKRRKRKKERKKEKGEKISKKSNFRYQYYF